MLFAREKDVTFALRQAFRRVAPEGMFLRVEDASGNIGTFDAWLACTAHGMVLSAWVELKWAGPEAAPPVRAGQPGFAIRCWDAGIPARLLVGHPDGSCRVIDGRTMGKDWRDHMVLRHNAVDDRVVAELLMPK